MIMLPRFQITLGGFPLTDPVHGLRQRDVLEAEVGMSPQTPTLTGGGQHGGIAGRTIYGPGLTVVPVDVYAVYGSTTEQRESSYRDALRWLKQIARPDGGGTGLRCEAEYGDGTVLRANVACGPLVKQDDIIEGVRWGVPITNLSTWRETIDREATFATLGPDETVVLDGWIGSTASLTALTIEIEGPSDPITITPLDGRLGALVPWSFVYDVTIPVGETVTIDTATGEITSTDNDLIDYSKMSHPGNPGYLLEIPPGAVGSAPSMIVEGEPAGLTISGRRVFTEL